MLEPGGELDLALEPLGAERGCHLRVQHLEGHLALVLEIAGEKNRRHAAPAELALDEVAAGQGGLEAGEEVGQSGRRGGTWECVARESP